MATNSNRGSRNVGEVGRLHFTLPLTIGIISASVVTLLILLFIFQPIDREIIKFSASSIAVAVGITSAFYVGETLRRNVATKKVDRAMEFISTWTSPPFAAVRKSARTIRQEIAGKPNDLHSEIIKNKLQQDVDLTEDIVTILNFLEEVALAIESDLADEDILYNYFKIIVSRFCHVFELFIAEERRNRGDDLYRGLTNLHEKWKKV